MANQFLVRCERLRYPVLRGRQHVTSFACLNSKPAIATETFVGLPVIIPTRSLSCLLQRASTGLHPSRQTVLTRERQACLVLVDAQRRWRYWDFHHAPDPPMSNVRKLFYCFIAFLSGCVLYYGFDEEGNEKELPNVQTGIDLSKITKSVKAASSLESDSDSLTEEEEDTGEEEEAGEKKKRKKVGFRDRRIIGYEDRIRAYSTPDKIFRYFATLKVLQGGEWEVYMTPEDFVRSITPGIKQPEGLGLDSFRKFDPKYVKRKVMRTRHKRKRNEKKELVEMVDPDSIFHKIGQSGLISFSDYIFLLTVLSTPPRNFEIGFRMFDFNGDGEVDIEEFNKVSGIIRNQSSIGKRHRNHSNTGSVDHGLSSGLSTFFFGRDGHKKLTAKVFLHFQEELHKEINKIEYTRHAGDSLMTERDFGSVLITYAGLPESKKNRMLKRVRRKYKEDPKGITFDEYLSVWKFLQNVNDVDTALSFYHLAGVSIDQETFKHVARTVAHVDFSDHVVDVIFTLFDENNDGELSNKEFVSVMKRRVLRGLEKPKDTGFVKLINAMVKCATSTHMYHE